MQRRRAGCRAGLTLVEVLLVVAILSLIATITIPAIQSARESARRTQCMNNMRQYGLAFAGVESQQGAFPASITARITGPLSGDVTLEGYSYMIDLLPFLEAQAASSAYHRDAMFCAPENAAVTATVLNVAICPSAPDRDLVSTASFMPSLAVGPDGRAFPLLAGVYAKLDQKYSATYPAAITDYVVAFDTAKSMASRFGYPVTDDQFFGVLGMYPMPINNVPEALTALAPILASSGSADLQRRYTAEEITDGLSHTFMLTESAGRPQRWQNGAWTGANEPLDAGWANPFINLEINGVSGPKGFCLMQCDNDNEIYSFHPAGVNFLFADGHVQLAQPETDPKILLAWLSPDQADSP